jgi:F0F1-type ATP synthase membrane subunit b/b'
MILTGLVLAMTLNMAAMKGDPQDDARKAFNNCLVKEHNEAVEAKKSASEFNEQIAAACTETRKTYHDLIVRAELGFKAKLKDAEEFASEEIQAVVDSVTAQFGDNVSTGAKLQPEK